MTFDTSLKYRILTHRSTVPKADNHGALRINHGTPVLVPHGNDVSLDDPGAMKNPTRITSLKPKLYSLRDTGNYLSYTEAAIHGPATRIADATSASAIINHAENSAEQPQANGPTGPKGPKGPNRPSQPRDSVGSKTFSSKDKPGK